eukprot:TRINITY_DN7445_c0_g1_i2.p1 TRINITY_DN7445_c0_g1~~TRINITY_DN7445_c0_g1_i2.p1  ORF type:complete len:275 (-),score=42.51 TRINITY_DN7445_c0_g1_i2:689-1453(-)
MANSQVDSCLTELRDTCDFMTHPHGSAMLTFDVAYRTIDNVHLVLQSLCLDADAARVRKTKCKLRKAQVALDRRASSCSTVIQQLIDLERVLTVMHSVTSVMSVQRTLVAAGISDTVDMDLGPPKHHVSAKIGLSIYIQDELSKKWFECPELPVLQNQRAITVAVTNSGDQPMFTTVVLVTNNSKRPAQRLLPAASNGHITQMHSLLPHTAPTTMELPLQLEFGAVQVIQLIASTDHTFQHWDAISRPIVLHDK